MTTMNRSTTMQSRAKHRVPARDRYLPLAINLRGVRCLVVGGGRIGTRKALMLANAGANVTVLCPQISARLRERLEPERLEWRQGEYDASHLEGHTLVVAATDDSPLNLRIGRETEARGVLSCVVSCAASSRVIFPAVCRKNGVTLAVHTDGRDCRRSQAVRDRIAAALAGNSPGCIHPGLETGKVILVGAGPGAPDLISLRGYRALLEADAILADRLVPPDFLEQLGIARAGKLVRWLGEQTPRWTQERINRWLATAARGGRMVVRLKGGDPLIFGRGDAEIEHLHGCGIPWEVIPGCSSATAVLTAAGLPLTRHGSGRSFAVATARVKGGAVQESFPRADSLVILMGVGVLPQVASRLLADGWPPETPAAIIERGTLPSERRLGGCLAELSVLAREAGVGSPALIVLGEAARTVLPGIIRAPLVARGPGCRGPRRPRLRCRGG